MRQVNTELVNDTAKLIMHRLIARMLGRDPSLAERAKVSLGHSKERFSGYLFVREWSEFLELPISEMRRRLTSRDEEMTRLRVSSPFVLAQGVNFEDEVLRRRIWKVAKRAVVRSKRTAGVESGDQQGHADRVQAVA